MTFERRNSSLMTDAEVSSQEDSMPNIVMLIFSFKNFAKMVFF